jgi:hypothetical protein
MLRAGIIGLPNVGKSTLFNAVTRSRKAEAANYPFCTIDPNLGVVTVPDPRLETVARIAHSPKSIPATIEFIDIAGLVKGASEGAGLGNQFLAHIRETDAIVQVVRCFEDEDIIHELGSVDPLRDIGIINTELILADIATLRKRRSSRDKRAKTGDKESKREIDLIDSLLPHLDDGQPAITFPLCHEDQLLAREFFLLSAKPVIYACNVAENDLAAALSAPDSHPFVAPVRHHAATHHGTEAVVIAARIEEELGDLQPAEAAEFLAELGVTDSGASALIRAVYHLLDLRTFFTANDKEAHAWTIHQGDKAPTAAGAIHSDFERGFIAAEVVHFDDLAASGSKAVARDHGRLRIEGKDYVVRDGDLIEFRFHV